MERKPLRRDKPRVYHMSVECTAQHSTVLSHLDIKHIVIDIERNINHLTISQGWICLIALLLVSSN